MDDQEILLLVVAMMAVFALTTALAIWLVMRLHRKSDRPLSQDATGGIAVPVRQLKRTHGFCGFSKNGISPRLEITRDGLQFKVFKPDSWRFAEIAEVDAPWMPFGTRLAIRNREGARLYVDLAGEARARDLLRALPQTVPFTERATRMRDGVA